MVPPFELSSQPDGPTADRLRYFTEQLADHHYHIASREFAAELTVRLPVGLVGKHILPEFSASTDLSQPHLRADAIVARMPSHNERPYILAALGNVTVAGIPAGVAMPESQRADYYPAHFPARGPYKGFAVMTEGDDTVLFAQSMRGQWRELFRDKQAGNADEQPALFFARRIIDMAMLTPRPQTRIRRTAWNLSSHKMLPPNARKS